MTRESAFSRAASEKLANVRTGLAGSALGDARLNVVRSSPNDDISWRVGYEEAAFFRRLFKRTTGMTPGDYRKRFRIPDFARR
jgi:AraC-like DNA-binding protein